MPERLKIELFINKLIAYINHTYKEKIYIDENTFKLPNCIQMILFQYFLKLVDKINPWRHYEFLILSLYNSCWWRWIYISF